MPADSRPFVVARNEQIVPKQRCIERLPSGYSIREFYNHSEARYWYVVTALEVIPTKRRGRCRIDYRDFLPTAVSGANSSRAPFFNVTDQCRGLRRLSRLLGHLLANRNP